MHPELLRKSIAELSQVEICDVRYPTCAIAWALWRLDKCCTEDGNRLIQKKELAPIIRKLGLDFFGKPELNLAESIKYLHDRRFIPDMYFHLLERVQQER